MMIRLALRQPGVRMEGQEVQVLQKEVLAAPITWVSTVWPPASASESLTWRPQVIDQLEIGSESSSASESSSVLPRVGPSGD